MSDNADFYTATAEAIAKAAVAHRDNDDAAMAAIVEHIAQLATTPAQAYAANGLVVGMAMQALEKCGWGATGKALIRAAGSLAAKMRESPLPDGDECVFGMVEAALQKAKDDVLKN